MDRQTADALTPPDLVVKEACLNCKQLMVTSDGKLCCKKNKTNNVFIVGRTTRQEELYGEEEDW